MTSDIDNGLALIGNPDSVARQLEDQQRRLGYDVFCAQHLRAHFHPCVVAGIHLDRTTTV